jgi:predicted dehydrogenase
MTSVQGHQQSPGAGAPLRVGVLGGGAMAAVHLRTLSSSPYARVVGVAAKTLSTEVLALAELVGAQCTSVDRLLETGGLDAVVIATPTDTHADFACLAAEHHVAVFCEKPLARHPAEGERIANAVAAHGTKVAVGHVLRYFPEYEQARRVVLGGKLGTISTARMFRVNASPATVKGWYAEPSRSGGLLFDLAIHDLDWCRWTLGPVRRVYACQSGESGHEVVSVLLRHTGGAIAYIDASWRDKRLQTGLEICGTAGLYRVGGSTDAGFELSLDVAGAPSYLPGDAFDSVRADNPYRVELEDALGWFAGGPPPRSVLADGLAALRVAAAAEESIRRARPIEVEIDR